MKVQDLLVDEQTKQEIVCRDAGRRAIITRSIEAMYMEPEELEISREREFRANQYEVLESHAHARAAAAQLAAIKSKMRQK